MAFKLSDFGNSGQVHGLRGEINMFFDDDSACAPAPGDFLFADIDATMIPFEVESIRRRNPGHYLVKFYDIDSADEAEQLKNRNFFTEATATGLPADDTADEDGFYASDLIGYTVTDADTDRMLGTIEGYDDNTINVLLIVERPDSSRLLIPFADEYITDINTDERRLEVSLPDGFLDIQ